MKELIKQISEELQMHVEEVKRTHIQTIERLLKEKGKSLDEVNQKVKGRKR